MLFFMKRTSKVARAGIVAVSCIFCLIGCAHICHCKTKSFNGFEVAPYFIYTPDHHILMKFALAGDQIQKPPLLTVNGSVKNYQYQEDKISGLAEVDIGAVACDQEVKVALTGAEEKSGDNSSISFQIPSSPCCADKEISFVFIADTHGNSSFYEREMPFILKRHRDKNIIAIIHGGDWVNVGTDLVGWNQMAYAAGQAGSAYPILSAIGNHEYHGYTSWAKMQNQPEPQQPQKGNSKNPVIFKKYFFGSENDQSHGYSRTGYYSVHYPQTVLIFINSNFNNLSDGDREAQWSFIKRELTVAESEKKPFLIVSHHSLLGSNLFRINKIEGKLLREKLIPILEEQRQKFKFTANAVNHNLPMIAVLSAHGHLSEESEKNGIHYLNAGTFGGWPMFGLWGNPYKKTSSSLSSTYSIITVSNRGISIDTYQQIAGIWQ